MVTTSPATARPSSFSSPGAEVLPWAAAVDALDTAEVFWLTTIRPEGRPHVTPRVAVRVHDALYFVTNAEEREARNLAVNPLVSLTTGPNARNEEGLDLVIEGIASRVIDRGRLEAVAHRYLEKYGEAWRFTVGDDALIHSDSRAGSGEPGRALVFHVAPGTILAFGSGANTSQTR